MLNTRGMGDLHLSPWMASLLAMKDEHRKFARNNAMKGKKRQRLRQQKLQAKHARQMNSDSASISLLEPVKALQRRLTVAEKRRMSPVRVKVKKKKDKSIKPVGKKQTKTKAFKRIVQQSNRMRLLLIGSDELLGLRYKQKSKGLCKLLEQFLRGIGEECATSRTPIKYKALWHLAKVETLTFPCTTLHDALGNCSNGGAGRLGLQIMAAEKDKFPYTHVLLVDSFLPSIGCSSIDAVRETVKEIISSSVQYHVKTVVLCVLPHTFTNASVNSSACELTGDPTKEPAHQTRPRLHGLMGLTLHSNDFCGWDNTTEILVHRISNVPPNVQKNETNHCKQTMSTPSTPGLSSTLLPDINAGAERYTDQPNRTLDLGPKISSEYGDAVNNTKSTPANTLDKMMYAPYVSGKLPLKLKILLAENLGEFLVNKTESARQERLRLQILAHNAQRERLRETRQSRIDQALQALKSKEVMFKQKEQQSRSIAKAEAEAAGLPAKLARQKRIAWEAWLAGEQKREKRERKTMEIEEEHCRQVWEEMRAIAMRREKARQRELTQTRKRKAKVDKAIVAVLSYARKMYLKQQSKLDPADAELREIQAAAMKKMGRKQRALLDGWTTRKRLLAEAFAKLPFVCTAETFFERMELALHLGHVERSYGEPKLDTSFGPLVSATQGSPNMTYSGADFSHKLQIGSPFSVKGQEFRVKALRVNEIELDSQFTGITGKYKALYLEPGPVERYRIVPLEDRPTPLSVIFQAVSAKGRCW